MRSSDERIGETRLSCNLDYVVITPPQVEWDRLSVESLDCLFDSEFVQQLSHAVFLPLPIGSRGVVVDQVE